MTVLLIILIIFVLIFLTGFMFAGMVVYPIRFGVERTYKMEVDKGKIDVDQYSAWEKEEVRLESPYGYSLYGLFFPAAGSKRAVILTHGITYTLYGSIKYMEMFRTLGFNIFIYDNRFHGRSGGKYATFGYYEKHDLRAVTDWVEARIGEGAIIGTHGESMGAAISLQHAAIDPRVRFVIEDCSFNNLETLLALRLCKDFHLPRFPFLPLAMYFSRLLTGAHLEEVSPEGAVKEVTASVLFIHGAKDAFIPPWMAEKLFDAKLHGTRRLYLAPNAGHADSYWNNREEYASVVGDFLKENHLI